MNTVSDESPKSSHPDTDELAMAVGLWLKTLCEHGHPSPTWADAEHSSLLRRLLDGKALLPKPPPLRFSYPDYQLAEGLPVEIVELNIEDKNRVVVDQCPNWILIYQGPRSARPQHMTLRFKPTGDLYDLTVGEPWLEGIRLHSGMVLQRLSVEEK